MTQLSEVTGLDRRTVKHRLAEVKPFRLEGKAIIYDAQKVLPILLGFDDYRNQDTDKSLAEEQLRYEKARADKVELEVEKLRGEVVPIEDVVRTVNKEYTYVRTTILSLPAKRAKEFALEDDPSKIQALLQDDVNEVLAHLQADTNLDIAPEEEDEAYFPPDEEANPSDNS